MTLNSVTTRIFYNRYLIFNKVGIITFKYIILVFIYYI